MSDFRRSHTKQISAEWLIVILLTFAGCGFAQLESSKWSFGHGAGLDFAKGYPQVLPGTQMRTSEGCAAIADEKGNMLFYTDGITVWNKNNQAMASGKGLKGHLSSTQSAIIVPFPGNASVYYVFTMDSEANKSGFCYSIVDMRRNGGLGDVVVKNKQVKELCTEKLIAVRHQNGKDIWVIIHEYNSNAFDAYLLTREGLSVNPVVSKVGFGYNSSVYSAIGYMKMSGDKKLIAVAINGDRLVQLFHFDYATGVVSDPLTIRMNGENTPYGVEFSPNSHLLYVSTVKTGEIFQLNLENYTESAIQHSMKAIGQSLNKRNLGSLQLAIDGKIYLAEYQSKFLSSIEMPDILGAGCMFKPFSVSLNNGVSMFGLPTFFQDYVKPMVFNIARPFNSIEVKPGVRYTLDNVHFEFDKTYINDSSAIELDKLVQVLKEQSNCQIEITGHTDSLGKDSYNFRLSHLRADAVGDYLMKKGINKSRIFCVGKGSKEPICENDDESGRHENRRVEFVLSEMIIPLKIENKK